MELSLADTLSLAVTPVSLLPLGNEQRQIPHEYGDEQVIH